MTTVKLLDLAKSVNDLYRQQIPEFGDDEFSQVPVWRFTQALKDGVISLPEYQDLTEEWDKQFEDGLNLVTVECRNCHQPFPADMADGRFADQFCSIRCEDNWINQD